MLFHSPPPIIQAFHRPGEVFRYISRSDGIGVGARSNVQNLTDGAQRPARDPTSTSYFGELRTSLRFPPGQARHSQYLQFCIQTGEPTEFGSRQDILARSP